MNAALWRSDNKRGNPQYLGDRPALVPPCPPQIYLGMGLPYFGFVADKMADWYGGYGATTSCAPRPLCQATPDITGSEERKWARNVREFSL
jgi:hypothetical protein